MLLNEMEIFYTVVDLKSFSKAADKLKVSKSFISKKITKLEKLLQIKLLLRSTHQLVLTNAGEKFFEYCRRIIEEQKAAIDAMQIMTDKPSGTLKITAPPVLGTYVLPSILTAYTTKYPDVKLNVQLDTRLVDLINEGYDIAFRSAQLESSSLIAQRIYSVSSVICATKKYYEKFGFLNDTKNIPNHNWAIFSTSEQMNVLKLIKDGKVEIYDYSSHFRSNSLELIKRMMLSDQYIGHLPTYMVTHELNENILLPCLNQYQLSESLLYAVYPERHFMLPKLKFFLEVVKNVLQKNPL